jgi:hypothetical protein
MQFTREHAALMRSATFPVAKGRILKDRRTLTALLSLVITIELSSIAPARQELLTRSNVTNTQLLIVSEPRPTPEVRGWVDVPMITKLTHADMVV